MIAYDTDILSELIDGNPKYVARANAYPLADQCIPVVAAAEVVRGWLAAVRKAETGRMPGGMEGPLRYLYRAIRFIGAFEPLQYTPAAGQQLLTWRAAKIKVGTNDLQIAAIAVAHGVKLATRNARDFAQVPGLLLDVWN